jgi:hypothetical protein
MKTRFYAVERNSALRGRGGGPLRGRREGVRRPVVGDAAALFFGRLGLFLAVAVKCRAKALLSRILAFVPSAREG